MHFNISALNFRQRATRHVRPLKHKRICGVLKHGVQDPSGAPLGVSGLFHDPDERAPPHVRRERALCLQGFDCCSGGQCPVD